ncbi:MAG: DNA polymerase III subunit gamma/tau [Chitinophagia bacterium]|nr:DNA polymerase III subunit gamma/tau [Chitinophagia bacterium]
MEHFVVSARKYRPQHFNTVVGQSHITTTLKNAILQQHLAHAFLFCGPRGVGKTTCARILAKTINCENLTAEGEACDQCASCQSFNKGTSFSVHELDAASNNSVDDIRELIEQVRFSPQAGKYKIYIIDEVHMLSTSAFNAFLKTLEEPPAHAIFILATTEKHKILPTILSRCQIFDFKRITPNDIVEHLQEIAVKEKIDAEASALQVIAQKSDGCMRDALSILDKIVSFTNGHLTYANTLEHLNLLDEDHFFRLLEMLEQEDLPAVLNLYKEIDEKGFEGDMVLNLLSEFFRNLLVSRDPRSLSMLQVVEGFRNRYIAAAASLSTAYIIGSLNILNEAELGFKQARNKKLHVEFHLIRLTYLKQAITLVEEDTTGKKKRLDELRAVSFRTISMREMKKQEPKLFIQETKTKSSKAEISVPTPAATNPAVANPSPVNPSPLNQKNEMPEPTSGPGLGALKKIREQMQHRKQDLTVAEPITQERLQEAWEKYLQKLLDNNQVSSQSNLRMAVLTILTENMFEVLSFSKIQMQFIENERVGLLIHIQEFFKNTTIQFKLVLDPSAEVETTKPEQSMTLRDQYLKMVSLYPNIKELRDQLNLDLDY